METLILILLAMIAVLAVLLYLKPKAGPLQSRDTRPLPSRTTGEVLQWERRVLTQLRGDRAAMERLLSARRRRFPHAGRQELLQHLHEEYTRDNR